MTKLLAAMPKYEAYKDSGVEWIEEIPKHWEVKKLKFEDRTNMGQSPNSEDCNVEQKGIPFLQGNAEFGKLNPSPRLWCTKPKKIAEKGDILLSVRAPVGAINIADQRLGIGRGLTAITPGTSNISFKLYQLIVASVALNRLSTGSTFDAVSGGDVNNLLLPVPPISEQNNIANFLDQKTAQINQAIAIKEKQITLLKERKQILIQNAVTRGLNPDAPMRDSGVEWLGDVPAHWVVHRVKNIFRLIAEPAEKNNSYELLSIYTDIGVKPRKELEERGNKASTTDGYWFVKKGDFIVNKLLAWMGAIGLSEYDGVTSPAYDILRSKKELNGFFYHYLFRTKVCSEELKKHSRGIMEMRLRLYFDKFGSVSVPYPDKREQDAIVAYIETESGKIDNAISLMQQQIEKLKEYKATLINSAVTGKMVLRRFMWIPESSPPGWRSGRSWS